MWGVSVAVLLLVLSIVIRGRKIEIAMFSFIERRVTKSKLLEGLTHEKSDIHFLGHVFSAFGGG